MKKLIVLSFIVVAIFACVLESKYALPETQVIDKDLIGTWRTAENNQDQMIISRLSKTRYTILIPADSTMGAIQIEAFPVRIGEYTLLNVVGKEGGKVTNSFYEYKVSNDEFSYREVSDKGMENDFQSAEELLEYFQENISKPNFFSEELIVLFRVNNK